jgi:hypothetical protein
MSIKRIILLTGGFLVIIGATIGVLYILNIGRNNTLSRGVKPTDAYVFKQVSNVSSLPIFSELPAESSGWKKTTSTKDSSYVHTQFVRDNACSIDIASQLLPNIQKDEKDFQLSKALVGTLALTEEGNATDPYVITLRSSKGDIDFYSALYNPKLQLIHSTGTTPTNQGGSKKREGAFTTYIVARVFTNQIDVGESTKQSGIINGIVQLGSMMPAVIINYTCPADRFDVSDPLRLLEQIKVDFPSTAKITSATSGK